MKDPKKENTNVDGMERIVNPRRTKTIYRMAPIRKGACLDVATLGQRCKA